LVAVNAILIRYQWQLANLRALYESIDGPAGRPAENPPNSDGFGVYHGTVPKWAVQVYWRPGPPIWQRFGLDPDPDPKWRSGTVANTTSGVANRFKQHGLQSVQSIATYIISSGMSVFCASVQRTNLEIMCILTRNTPGGITTYIARSVMPTLRQRMPNSRRAMFTEDSTCFDIFPVFWAISRSPTSSIQCRSACLTTSRSGFSTS